MKGRKSQVHSVVVYTSVHFTLQKTGTGGIGTQKSQVTIATWCNAFPDICGTEISKAPLVEKSSPAACSEEVGMKAGLSHRWKSTSESAQHLSQLSRPTCNQDLSTHSAKHQRLVTHCAALHSSPVPLFFLSSKNLEHIYIYTYIYHITISISCVCVCASILPQSDLYTLFCSLTMFELLTMSTTNYSANLGVPIYFRKISMV